MRSFANSVSLLALVVGLEEDKQFESKRTLRVLSIQNKGSGKKQKAAFHFHESVHTLAASESVLQLTSISLFMRVEGYQKAVRKSETNPLCLE